MKFVCDDENIVLYYTLASLAAAASVSFLTTFCGRWQICFFFHGRAERTHYQIVTLALHVHCKL